MVLCFCLRAFLEFEEVMRSGHLELRRRVYLHWHPLPKFNCIIMDSGMHKRTRVETAAATLENPSARPARSTAFGEEEDIEWIPITPAEYKLRSATICPATATSKVLGILLESHRLLPQRQLFPKWRLKCMKLPARIFTRNRCARTLLCLYWTGQPYQ